MTALPADQPLSPRRLEILRLAANGRTSAEIARELWISEESVKSHMQLAYRALGARDRANAVAIALVRGLIAPHEVELRAPGVHRGLSASAAVAPSRAHSGPCAAVQPPEVRGEPGIRQAGADGRGGVPVERLAGPTRIGTDAGGPGSPQAAQNGPSRRRTAPGGPVPASSPGAPATATSHRIEQETQQ